MRLRADAESLCAALAGLGPFVDTSQDAGPAGMIHLSYVPAGGLLATAYGNSVAAAWIPAETEDGDLASFAIERADAKMITSAFRKAIGWMSIDVEAKELKSVVDTDVVLLNGDQMDARESTRREIAYSITLSEDSGLFGNRMVKVSTAAQPEAHLEDLWDELRKPLRDRMPALEEYKTSLDHLAKFKAAEKAYNTFPVIEPASLGGSLLVRVGENFVGRCFGTGQDERSDAHRNGWVNRLPAHVGGAE